MGRRDAAAGDARVSCQAWTHVRALANGFWKWFEWKKCDKIRQENVPAEVIRWRSDDVALDSALICRVPDLFHATTDELVSFLCGLQGCDRPFS